MPMPAATASRGVASRIGVPSRTISPASGMTRPARMFISVDLPAPFSPRTPSTSLAASDSDTSSLATTPGKLFVTPRSSSRGARATATPGPGSANRWQIAHLAGFDIGQKRLHLGLVLRRNRTVELAVARKADAILIEAQQVVLGFDAAIKNLGDRHLQVDVEIDECRGHNCVRSEGRTVERRSDH